MAVSPSTFGPKPQFELASGVPAVGNLLFFYVAGSVNTKQDTYTNSTGGSANTNPIVLNSLGQPPNEIWFTDGLVYKVVYAPAGDTDPPSSPIWTIDNLRGINDSLTLQQDQWVAFGGVPTFVSGTSFTLVGDQTSTLHAGRRIKTTNSGGTVYSIIKTSVFGVLTTITVANDSGVLDSGLSAVSYGILSRINPSIPGMTEIWDSGGNEILRFVPTASAVNGIAIVNAATGQPPVITTSGEANNNLDVRASGTGVFRIQDPVDSTKRAGFDVSGISSGTARLFTFPNASTTFVGTDTTQTLTNKTLTSPVLNTGVSGTAVADQTAMEAASSTSLIATPGRMINHPGMTKAWGHGNYAGAADAGFNLSSVTDNGTGDQSYNMSITMNGQYIANVTADSNTNHTCIILNKNATSVQVGTLNIVPAFTDATASNFEVHGDL